MLNTVNDIIEISKIETRQVKKNIEPININTQLIELYDFFKLETQEKNISIDYHLDLSNSEAILFSDISMFNSIVTNLIKNAIKFTDRGGLSFGYKHKGRMIEFFVKDIGIGIPDDKQKMVFERFN